MTEPEAKPIVGDDGELIEDDPYVDVEVYIDTLLELYPESLTGRIRYHFAKNPVRWTVILLVVFIGILMNMPQVTEQPELMTYEGYMPPVRPPGTRSPADPPAYLSILSKGEVMKASIMPNVTQVRWSPTGDAIAFQGGSSTLRIWSLEFNQIKSSTFNQPAQFDWSPDGQYLYINTRDSQTATKGLLQTSFFTIDRAFLPTAVNVPQPPFLADGLSQKLIITPQNLIFLLAEDGLAFSIINLYEPNTIITKRLDTPAHDIDWMGDGLGVSLTTAKGILKWELTQDSPYEIIEGDYQQTAWSPGGDQFATTQDMLHDGLHRLSVTLFSNFNHHLWTTRLMPGSKSITRAAPFNVRVAWSPRNDRIATFMEGDNEINVWDDNSGRKIDWLATEGALLNIDWSADGQYLAIGTSIGLIIWSPEG